MAAAATGADVEHVEHAERPRAPDKPVQSEHAKPRPTVFQFLCQLARTRYCGFHSERQWTDPATLQIGPTVGKGAYAIVSLCDGPDATHRVLTRHALKQLKPAVATDKVELKFFLLEAHIISQLRHRSIISFRGFGLRKPGEIQSAFYLMEHLPGGSLKALYRKHEAGAVARAHFTTTEAMRWSIELTSAVAHMHSLACPIVHRDIKLENVLLTSARHWEASVKLADFGLSVQLGHRGTYPFEVAHEKLSALQTEASGPIATHPDVKWYHLTGQSGSLLYMAPEVYLNLPYNEKADVFSLGVVIYELFTGVQLADVVLKERTWAEAKEFARAVAHGRRIRVALLAPDLAALITACWHQDPTRRPTAVEVLERLLRLQGMFQQQGIVRDERAGALRPAMPNMYIGRGDGGKSWMRRSLSKVSQVFHRRVSI